MSKVTPQDVYRQVDLAVNTNIQENGVNGVTGLAQAVVVATGDPVTTYHTVNSSDTPIVPELITKAAKVFKELTGFDPSELTSTSNTEKEVAKKIINYNAFFIYLPIGLLFFIAIWLMVGFGWIIWPVGIFLTMFLVIIVYIFNITYRVEAQAAVDRIIDQENETDEEEVENLQNKMKTFVAYLPQLIHAIATAIKSD